MKILSLICVLFLFTQYNLTAQCNPSNQVGVHVVQSGETLYQIASRYNVSVSDICFWNSLNHNEIIPVCTKLKVVSTGASNRPKDYDTTSNTDTFWDKSGTNNKQTSLYKKQAGDKHTVQPGETIAGLAELYGYTEARFRKFNAMGSFEKITVGSILLSTDCKCGRVNSTSSTGFYNTSTDTNPNTNSNTQNNAPANSNTNSNYNANASASYMKPVELSMVDEINLLRSNPSGYVRYIEEYVAEQRNNNGFPINQSTVDELIRELRNTSTLSTLSPTPCIYRAAKKHGDDILSMGKSDHVGSDGAWPWDRVKRECPQMSDGNENLVGGPATVRASVVILLIDEGIASRGHRKTLLNPKWSYVATYKIGQVGYMPNSWIQKFGAN